MTGRRRMAALVLAVTVGLSGCATVAAPGTGSLNTGGPQDTSRTLRIMGPDFPYTDATITEFRRQHPDIKLEYVKGAVSFEEGSAQTLLRSGSGPDVLLVNSGPGRVGLLADAGLIASLDEIFEKDGLDERFDPGVLEQTRAGQGGHVYEIVEGLDVFQVYYNKAVFDRHGVTVPKTWAEFLSTCTTLRAAGVLPLVAGVRDNFAGGWLLGALVQASAGRDTMSEIIYGDRSFADPAVVAGGQAMVELLERGCLDGRQAAALDGGQADAAFWRGAAAMTVIPQGSMVEAERDGTDVSSYAAFPMPPREAGADALPTAGLAVSWVVNNSTRSLSAVNAWLSFISSAEYLELTAQHRRTLVPAQKVPADLELEPSVRESLEKVAQGTGFNPSVYLPEAAKEAWYQAVQGLITGRTTPDKAMKAVQDKLAATR